MAADMIHKPEHGCSDWCSLDKFIGVGIIGALGSMLLYYLYFSLSEDSRVALKEAVMSQVKSGIRKIQG